MDPAHDRPIGRNMPSKLNRHLLHRHAGRMIGLFFLCVLATIAVACTPMVQIQVTRGAPTTPTAASEEAIAQSANAVAASTPVRQAGPGSSDTTEEPTAGAQEPASQERPASQVRLAAPIEGESTPLPTATVTLTPTPTVIPPATSPPDRLIIPSIGINAPVQVAGWVTDPDTGSTFWETPTDAAGFHRDSALPGWAGNTVLSGHHNIEGKVFENLHQLAPGSAITLYVEDMPYQYTVADNFIVQERDASEAQRRQNAAWIAPTDDERLTLVTCWPANDNSHRLIVIARPMMPDMLDHAASAQEQASTDLALNGAYAE